MDLAKTDRTPLEIIAHESAVTCLALNIQGTRLATAGERGTLIRIFDTSDGTKLAELRRGTHHVSTILLFFAIEEQNLLYYCIFEHIIYVFVVVLIFHLI